MTAKLSVIRYYAVADLEAHNLGALRSYDTNGLVAGDERELGDELALVNMLNTG